MGSLCSRFERILSRLRVGQRMTGPGPRNNTARHAPSTGEWKPPMTVTPPVRHRCARSCTCKIMLAGALAEQNRASSGLLRLSQMSRSPHNATICWGLFSHLVRQLGRIDADIPMVDPRASFP